MKVSVINLFETGIDIHRKDCIQLGPEIGWSVNAAVALKLECLV